VITITLRPLSALLISSHSYSQIARRKSRRNFTPNDTLFLLQPSPSRSRYPSFLKFSTSTAKGYYLSHSKFIVRRVIIMPFFVRRGIPNDGHYSKKFSDGGERGRSEKRRHDIRRETEEEKKEGIQNLFLRPRGLDETENTEHSELAPRFSLASHRFSFRRGRVLIAILDSFDQSEKSSLRLNRRPDP